MKVILYAAMTTNGMVAKVDGNSDWPSKEDLESFNNICRKSGGTIMGRKTFDIFNNGIINDWPNANGLHIVLTSQETLKTGHPNIRFVKSPVEAVDFAKTRGLDEVVVCGGSQIFGIFMKEKLIDEIYFDIEPLVFGKGMPFVNNEDLEFDLELIELKLLNKNTIQLHYKAIKV